jgi:hypothetical protein
LAARMERGYDGKGAGGPGRIEFAQRDPAAGGGWLYQPLISRPLGYTEMRADWSQVMDGLLFLRVMAPSTRAAR